MGQFFRKRRMLPLSRDAVTLSLFCIIWLAGLACGGFIAVQASDHYLLMMRGAISSPVSITGLLTAVFLPFLFIAFSVYISRPKLIYPICFLKACSFAVTGFAVEAVFGSAGWLVRFMLQFTDTDALALLCWFACRHLDGRKNRLWTDTALCAVCTACLGCIDYCYISPFLALLTENSLMGR